MLRSMLIGAVAGARSLTPLALLSLAARGSERSVVRRNRVSRTPELIRRTLARPVVAAGTTALAAGELWGDKLHSAPDRIVPAGMAARLLSSSIAGAALAPRGRWGAGALVGASTAVISAHLTFAARMRAMQRYGQTPTGVIEDALALGIAWLAIRPRRT